MTTFRPIYRARVYAPRSTDPTETTILTPTNAGAPHADKFCVATKRGIVDDAGNVYQPYLHGGPRGRGAEIEPLDKSTDIGEYVWTIMDRRTGSANLQRWLTAFLGDAKGGNQLLGLRFEVDESLDNGATWSRFATTRVQSTRSSSGSRVWIQVAVRDVVDDLDNDIFLGPPHAGASAIAHHAQVFPLGLLRPYGDFKRVSPARATVISLSGSGSYTFRVDIRTDQPDAERLLATKALMDIRSGGTAQKAGQASRSGTYGRALVWIAPHGTPIGDPAWTAYDFDTLFPLSSTCVSRMNVRPLQGNTTTPALNADIDLYIETLVGGVSESVPLLINDVHPVTLARYLCLGYFGKIDTAGNTTWSVPFNAANFAALEADASFPKVRFVITEKATLQEWLTENVLKPNHLALRVNELGQLEIVDMRRSAAVAAAWTLGNADVVASSDSFDWENSKADAIAAVRAVYFGERQIENDELPKPWEAVGRATAYYGAGYAAPDIPTVRIEELTDYPVVVTSLGSRALDVGGNQHEIKCPGLRFRVGATPADSEKLGTELRGEVFKAFLIGLASDIRSPFALGPRIYELVGRRASANAALVKVGTTGVVDLDELPDPATGVRGGPRLAICLARIADGPRVRFRMLDWGSSSIGIAPTLGAPAALASHPSSAFSLPVTLNTDGQLARVEVAITSTAVGVRPSDTSGLWRTSATLEATGTAIVDGLQGAGKRVWIRARSEDRPGAGFTLPSAWAYPAANYIDLAALAAPTGINVSSSANVATVTWTNGSALLLTEVFIKPGAAAPDGTNVDEKVSQALPAGSTAVEIVGGMVPGNQYTVGIRHVDEYGNISAIVGYAFVAAAAGTLAPPRNPDGYSHSFGIGLVRITRYGLAVIASEFPGEVEFAQATETGVGTGVYGAYETVGRVPAVAGDWTRWSSTAPNDRRRRKLKARTARGDEVSAYCGETLISPWLHDPLAEYPIATPWASVRPVLSSRSRSNETLQIEGALGAGDSGPLSWRYQIDDGAWSSASTTALPVQIVVPRAKFFTKHVTVEVTQADGQTATASATVLSELEPMDDTNGRIKRPIPFTDGDYAVPATNTTGTAVKSTVTESGGKLMNRLLAKPLSSDPDTADSVVDGSTKRALPFTIIRASDSALMTRVDHVATIGASSAQNVEKQSGNYFNEVFNQTLSAQGWENAGGGTETQSLVGGLSKTGTYVLRVTGGMMWRDYGRFLPYNPTKLYRIRVRFRQTAVTGSNQVLIGLRGFLADGSPANNNGGYMYNVIAETFPASATWIERTLWIKGATHAYAAGSAASPSADPRSPSSQSVDTALVKPIIACNYSSGSGTFEIDYLQIDELDEDAAARVYNTVQSDNATLYSSVKESGAKAINRLLSKALASDPDNADSVLGGSVRRVPLVGATDSSGTMNLAGSAWINKNAFNLAPGVPMASPTWSHSGMTAFSAGAMSNGDVTDAAWHTDSATTGAWIMCDLGASDLVDQCRIFATGGNNAIYEVHYSSDGVSWTAAAVFGPLTTGWNVKTFGAVNRRYWRIYLQNTPGGGSWMSECWFMYSGTQTAAHHLAVDSGHVAERAINVIKRASNSLRDLAKTSDDSTAVNRLYAKSLSSSPNSADSIASGVTNRTIPFSVIRAADDAITTRLARSAQIGDMAVGVMSRRQGIFYSETFDNYGTESDWEQAGTNATFSTVQTIGLSKVSSNVLQVVCGGGGPYAQVVGRNLFPINPSKLYRIRVRYRKVSESGSGNNLYLGFFQKRSDGTAANNNSGAMYIVASGLNPSVGTWVEQTLWVKGATRAYTDTGTGTLGTDPRNPATWNQDATHIQIYSLIGYPTGSSTWQFDYFQIDEMDEEQADRVYSALESGTVIRSGVGQTDGVSVRALAKGHTAGQARNGNSVSFPISYQNVPMVLLRGGINHEPRAKWGANGDGSESGAYSTTLPTYEDMQPLDLTVSGFTLRARLRQKSTITARSANADSSSNSLTAAGQTAEATLNNCPNGAVSDQYTVHFKISVTCTNISNFLRTATVVLAIDTSSDGGSSWIERGTYSYTSSADAQSTWTEDYDPDSKTINVAGLSSNATADKIRIRIVSKTVSGSSATAGVVAHLMHTTPDGQAALTYNTSTGDSYASKTPDADDAIYFEAIEVS